MDARRTSTPEFKERRKAYDRERWENDREYLVSKNRRYYEKNKDAVNEQKRGYWKKNVDAMKEARKIWAKENIGRIIHLNRLRVDRIKQATPAWADLDEIRAIYEESARLTRETGIQHHVDHIVPLNGENVCGLHVQFNLRAIPWNENVAKSNLLIEDLVVAS